MGSFFSSGTREIQMDPATVTLVEDAIKSDFVVIFSKTYCPFCKLAKEVSKTKITYYQKYLYFYCIQGFR